jgi:hypothetical protein
MRNQTLKPRHWIVDSERLTLNLAFPQGLFLKLAEEGAVDEELFVNPEVKFQTPSTKHHAPCTKHQTPNTKHHAPCTKQQTTNNKQQML